MGIKFLPRDIHPQGPQITLCTSEDEYLEVMRHFGVKYPDQWITRGKGATRHTLECDSGGLACVVCIDAEKAKDRPLADVCGLLVHEAVHVWQSHAEDIGERHPGGEQEAYAIGMIAQALIAEWLGRQVATPGG